MGIWGVFNGGGSGCGGGCGGFFIEVEDEEKRGVVGGIFVVGGIVVVVVFVVVVVAVVSGFFVGDVSRVETVNGEIFEVQKAVKRGFAKLQGAEVQDETNKQQKQRIIQTMSFDYHHCDADIQSTHDSPKYFNFSRCNTNFT